MNNRFCIKYTTIYAYIFNVRYIHNNTYYILSKIYWVFLSKSKAGKATATSPDTAMGIENGTVLSSIRNLMGSWSASKPV